MKVRNGFVSNSSSSSFIINDLDKLSDTTVDKIVNYDGKCYQYLKKRGMKFSYCGEGFGGMFHGRAMWVKDCPEELDFGSLNDAARWNIRIENKKNCIELQTYMTNFDMGRWLDFLGVKYTVLQDGDGRG